MAHATIVMEVKIDGRGAAGEARARRRMVPVGRHAAARRADHSKRDQSAPLRHAQGHHGARRRRRSDRPRPCRPPRDTIVALYVPEKAKNDTDLTGSPADAAKELVGHFGKKPGYYEIQRFGRRGQSPRAIRSAWAWVLPD